MGLGLVYGCGSGPASSLAKGFKASRNAETLAEEIEAAAGTKRDRGAGDRGQGRTGRIGLWQGRGRPRGAARSVALIHATDGAADGIRKLDDLAGAITAHGDTGIARKCRS